MPPDTTEVGHVKVTIVGLVVTAAVLLTLIDMIFSVLAFLFDYRGLEFYRERPYLGGLCLIVGILVAVLVKIDSERWWRATPSTTGSSGASKPVGGEGIGVLASRPSISSTYRDRNRPFPRWAWMVISLLFGVTAFQFGSIAAYAVWFEAYAWNGDGFWTRMFYFHMIGFLVAMCLAVGTVAKAIRRPSV